MGGSNQWTVNDIPDLSGKTIVVTGANSGIGFESARELSRAGAEVIMASRNPEKAEQARDRILAEIPAASIEFMKLDLASLGSIREFAAAYNARYHKLDILLNNAGIMLVPYRLTEDGFETTLGINHLGHFALTGLLLERLLAAPGARVVNVSSNAHYAGELDFSDLAYMNRTNFTPMKAYSRSKLANLLFTYELQRRFQQQGIPALALAAHPGISATGLADHFFNYRIAWLIRPLMRLAFQSSAMGALPSLRAATDPRAQSGMYFGPDGKGERAGFPVVVKSNPASHSAPDAARLWQVSQALTGIHYLD